MARLRRDDALLVRLPSWLGDFVMAEPTVSSLVLALRTGQLGGLTLAAPERFFDLFDGRFEGVRCIALEDDWSGHDVALFLDGSARSVMRALRAGIGVRVCWASGGRALFASESYRPAVECGGVPLGLGKRGRGARRLPRPFGATCAELAGMLGVPVIERAPRLRASIAARTSVRARLNDLGLQAAEPFVLLDASARVGSAKGAPAELWTDVLAGLERAGAPRVVIASAPGEETTARKVFELAGGKGLCLFDVPPPTLGELLALMEACDLFLGCDSGPRHLAVATGCPEVILCGPTDPRHTADHTEATTIVRREIECGPCHQEQCPLPPGRANGACMSELPVQAIVDAVVEALR